MKKLLFAIMIGMASQANATIFELGDFAWTDYTGFGNGVMTRDLGTNTATIQGSADPVFSGGFFDPTQMTAISLLGAAGGAGTVSFNYDYVTNDGAGAFYDPFTWLYDADGTVDPTVEILPEAIENTSAAGVHVVNTFSRVVGAGSIFGFSIDTLDNLLFATDFASVTITDFTFDDGFGANPIATPVPPAFLLFGTALAGLGFFRKKKAAA